VLQQGCKALLAKQGIGFWAKLILAQPM